MSNYSQYRTAANNSGETHKATCKCGNLSMTASEPITKLRCWLCPSK